MTNVSKFNGMHGAWTIACMPLTRNQYNKTQ